VSANLIADVRAVKLHGCPDCAVQSLCGLYWLRTSRNRALYNQINVRLFLLS